MESEIIKKFKERRKERLTERLSEDINAYKWRRVARLLARYDADDDGDQQNNSGGGDKGGHGNTRLPYGLCARFGITVEKGWSPRDCWDALAGKGITAEGAYARLKKGEDPGTPAEGGDKGAEIESAPEAVEPPKEPKKTAMIYGIEVGDLSIRKRTWDDRYRYELRGLPAGERWTRYMQFYTKEDLYYYLKDQGVEEISDPDTGEIVDPTQMELPAYDAIYDGRRLTKVALGFVGGEYKLSGTDLAGKKVTVGEFDSMQEAKRRMQLIGVSEDKVKKSPKLMKREEERVAWLKSDKKEYIEIGGEKYGDLRGKYDGYSGYDLSASTESGQTFSRSFDGKMSLLKYLKEQGVENAKIDGEFVNPQDVEIPKARKYGFRRGEYTGLAISSDWRSITVLGVTIDGKQKYLGDIYVGRGGDFDEAVKKFEDDTGITVSDICENEKTKEEFEQKKAEFEERARIRREFEAKKERWGWSDYADVKIEKNTDWDGEIEYRLIGFDSDGDKQTIRRSRDFGKLAKYIKEQGKDVEKYAGEDVADEFKKHKERVERFNDEAVSIGAYKVVEPSLKLDWDGKLVICGKDEDDCDVEVADRLGYLQAKKMIEDAGLEMSSLSMDDDVRQKIDRMERVDQLLKTGKYYTFDKDDKAYTDIRISKDSYGDWKVTGTDDEGKVGTAADSDYTWDDAIDCLYAHGVKEWKFVKDDGTVVEGPESGMRRVSIVRKPGGDYEIVATINDGVRGVVHTFKSEEECRKWLDEKRVNQDYVKTRGMHPGDDVPRVNYSKSLMKFDDHRYDAGDRHDALADLSEPDKIKAQKMMTETFDMFAYRMTASCDLFEKIFDNGFLNQFQSKSSGGAYTPDGRRGVEERTFGTPRDMSIVPKEEREKYGYLGRDDDLEAALHDPAKWYAGRSSSDKENGVCFKFKKDVVGEKSTYTFGDTLDSHTIVAGYTGKNPTYEGIGASDYDDADDVRRRLKYYDDFKAGKINAEQYFDRISNTCTGSYIEVQYHIKDFTMLDHVDSATFRSETGLRRAFGTMTNEKRMQVLQSLREHGIKLSYVKGGTLHDGYERLKELYGE